MEKLPKSPVGSSNPLEYKAIATNYKMVEFQILLKNNQEGEWRIL